MKYPLTILFLGMNLYSCSKDENQVNTKTCEFQIIINEELYSNAPSDELTINSFDIDDDCLRINFSAGGCSGDSWEVQLIASEIIMLSNPPRTDIKLSLKNEELCFANITK